MLARVQRVEVGDAIDAEHHGHAGRGRSGLALPNLAGIGLHVGLELGTTSGARLVAPVLPRGNQGD
jgi:hypothetical protein